MILYHFFTEATLFCRPGQKILIKIFNIKIYACHINHGIRGDEAYKDEEYVKEICNNLKIELDTYHFEIKKEAISLGLTEEETGRKIRYECFNKTLLKYNANIEPV